MYPRGHELAHSRSMNWVQSAFITVARSFSLRERHATFWVTWPSRLQRYMLSLARSLSVHCIYTHTGGRAGRSCSSRMCACAPLASRPEPLGFMSRHTQTRKRARARTHTHISNNTYGPVGEPVRAAGPGRRDLVSAAGLSYW